MVKSNSCHLHGLSREELVAHKEEATEFGGYFICNGIERIIRMLIQTRRHYILALHRSAYEKRGPSFTDMATMIRCVRPDESSLTNRCHYLIDGRVLFAVTIRRAEYFIPAGILLKCFTEFTDKQLFNRIVASAGDDPDHISFVAERVELILQQVSRFGLDQQDDAIEFLGSQFKQTLELPERKDNYNCGRYFLDNYMFVHVDDDEDKLALVYEMLLKLFALVNGQCSEDNPDALTHQEVLLPGHLLLKFMKEQLETCMEMLRQGIIRDFEREPETVNLKDELYLKTSLDKWPDVGQKFEYLLNTGNLVSRSGLDLSQATGFTVVAEKLNFYR